MKTRFGFSLLLMGLAMPAEPAAAQGQVPPAIKSRVNELVAACAQAGGKLGDMSGQGQFVIPVELTGDGRTDFLVSEGNFPCAGRPGLFRRDGLGRVEIHMADGAGGTRLLFDERLLAYRILAGTPARVQIARKGAACGAGGATTASTRCGDELRWNAAAKRFDAVATDGRPAAPRPIAAPDAAEPALAAGAAAGMAPAAGVAPTADGVAAAGAVPPILGTAESSFKANCRKAYLADKPQKTDWIDGSCADEWKRVAASQPVLEKLLLALPGSAGAAPTAADLKQRMAGVRWAPRADQGDLATGTFGGYGIGVTGKTRPETVNVNWTKVGDMIPLDIPAALAARGAKLTLARCEKMGVGEGERVWSVALPGRPAFELNVYERSAPTANAWSHYAASVRVDGAPPGRGPTNCERFW